MLEKVIFDMDGLIFDTERLFMNCLKAIMAKQGFVLTEEIYANTLGLSRKDCKVYMKSVFGESYPFEENSDAARGEIAILAQNGLPVKDGIKELLSFLNEHKIECVVASSSETEYIRLYLDKSGLLPYFSALYGGETVVKSKPNPDIFLKALGDTPKENTVILEDSENGIIAAFRAGIRVICIPDLKRPSADVLKKVFACVNSAADILKIEGLLC